MRRCLESLEGVSGGVLEIGCGAGRCIRTIAHHRPDLSAFGCDISEAAIHRARRHCDRVQYRTGNAADLPYESATFDAVVVMDLLEHVPDVAAVLAEIRRVSKPGARLHLHVPCEGSALTLYRPLLAAGIDLTRAAVGHIHHFTPRQVGDYLKAAGFAVRRRRYSMFVFGQLHDLICWWATGPKRPKAAGAEHPPAEADSGQPSRTGTRTPFQRLITGPAWWLVSNLLPRLQYAEVALFGWQPLGAVGLCLTADRGAAPPAAGFRG